MQTQLKIYIARLNGGHVEKIEEEIDSNTLEINEENLTFSPQVHIKGKTYLAEDHLIVQLSISADATIPCPICNEPVTIPLSINNFCHTVHCSSIKSQVFEYGESIREAILLNTPEFTECHGGTCPERKKIKTYFKPKTAPSSNVQYPFSDLDT